MDLPHRRTHQIAPCDPQPSTWARSQAYRDSLREEENRKLQKMKEEQHQKSELLELKRQQQEEERSKTQQAEHRRVNNAFLDRLQGRSDPGGLEYFGGNWNLNGGRGWDIWEIFTYIWPLSTDLENLREMLFFLMWFRSSSLLLPGLQLLTHSAEPPRVTGFSLSQVTHVWTSWLPNSYLTFTTSDALQYFFLIAFASYWQYNFSNVSKTENKEIIWCFQISEIYGCCMLVSLRS